MHEEFMHRCIELAERGRGTVGNGALVGAVLVRDDRILAEGFHAGFGLPHAERVLLEAFAGRIEPIDTLYVNLEPCCHHGKTAPCTDVIIERGIKRVVYGMKDPDARVAGKGIAALQRAGIAVAGSVDRAACEWLNRGFISVRSKGRPWITLKQARASDGRIAHANGSPLKITSNEQDVWSHTWLRATHDAILVGAGTVIADDPQLTVRHVMVSPTNHDALQPYRIILDPHLRIPLDRRVVSDAQKQRTIIVKDCKETKESKETKDILLQRGVRILNLAARNGSFDLQELWLLLTVLDGGAAGITSVLVEGGAKTWEYFRKAGVVDMDVTLVGS